MTPQKKIGFGWFMGTGMGILTFIAAAAWVAFTVIEGIPPREVGLLVIILFYWFTVLPIIIVGLGIANAMFALFG